MFTIVIPTMWRPDTFEEQLNSLCCSEYVDEIILINNNKDLTPDFEILNNRKILHINPSENLIVNPSWNLGVMLSNNNNICLLNDDILFDIDVFKFMSSHKDKHLCGLSMSNNNSEFEIKQANERTHGFGCMIFVRKDTYPYIPNNLLMFFGDDYLFNINKFNGNKNYYILGCRNNEVWGMTNSNMILINESKQKIVKQEYYSFERLMHEKGIILH